MQQENRLPSVVNEYQGAVLGDARRSARLLEIAAALDRNPQAGFPRMMGSEAELEAFYRFINNDAFSADDVLEPHLRATFDRAAEQRNVVVVHDTTPVTFGGLSRREGLGVVSSKCDQGFVAHIALMIGLDSTPLGVAHVETLTRSGTKRKSIANRRVADTTDTERESGRWLRSVRAVEDSRADSFQAIHVTDAEGDFFELLALFVERGARFVVRAGQFDRLVRVDGQQRPLHEAIASVTPRAFRDIELSERRYPKHDHRHASRHAERAARTARMAIGSTSVEFQRSKYAPVDAAPFAIHVVRVWELSPPPGEQPVDWVLLTTEPVATSQALARVVDTYRMRWTIEEYFKALKTGCSLERRQVESYDALRKVLALSVPIAYRLLLLRSLERTAGSAPADTVFSTTDLRILEHAPSNRGLPPPRTVADAIRHVARLGGHLRANGRPGWLVLTYGYQQLLTLRLGWELAQLAGKI